MANTDSMSLRIDGLGVKAALRMASVTTIRDILVCKWYGRAAVRR